MNVLRECRVYQSDGTPWPVLYQRFADIQSSRKRYVLSVQNSTVFMNTGSKENFIFLDMLFSLCKEKPLKYSRDSR